MAWPELPFAFDFKCTRDAEVSEFRLEDDYELGDKSPFLLVFIKKINRSIVTQVTSLLYTGLFFILLFVLLVNAHNILFVQVQRPIGLSRTAQRRGTGAFSDPIGICQKGKRADAEEDIQLRGVIQRGKETRLGQDVEDKGTMI